MVGFDAPDLEHVLNPGSLGRAVPEPGVRRLAWPGIPAALEGRVASERDQFDQVATWRRAQLQRELDGPWTQSPWLVEAEVASLLQHDSGLFDVRGLRILDVGGTMPVSWRFLRGGARAVHHVDVSPESQRVGFERCALHGVADERVVFHTAPVEALPFADGVFDLVFSRNSIHHTARPAAYDSLARVLKPGGRLLIFEPWLNRVLRRAVFARRRVLGIDRGTDDPLGRHDLAMLEGRFASVQLGLFGAGATPLIWALERWRPLHPALRVVKRVERRLGTRPRVARVLAVHGWILATA